MEAKISMLQTQVALLSLTVASMQAHIKDIDKTIQELKEAPLIQASDDLGIDDSSQSEGYDSDESDTSAISTQAVNKYDTSRGVSSSQVPYVLVSWEDEEYDSDENTLEEL